MPLIRFGSSAKLPNCQTANRVCRKEFAFGEKNALGWPLFSLPGFVCRALQVGKRCGPYNRCAVYSNHLKAQITELSPCLK